MTKFGGLMRRLAFLTLVLLLLTTTADGGTLGEVGIAVGQTAPQGEFAKFADPGFNAMLRVNVHPKAFPIASTWIDLNVAVFGIEEREIILTAPGTSLPPIPATEKISDYAVYIHAGLQLGSWTRKGFFRPRASLAPGLYLFNKHTSVRADNATEDLYSEDNALLRIGWRAVIGTDLFFTPKWGLSIEFMYDQVQNMHYIVENTQSGPSARSSRPARYHSIMAGVVIPLDIPGK